MHVLCDNKQQHIVTYNYVVINAWLKNPIKSTYEAQQQTWGKKSQYQGDSEGDANH